MRPFELVNILQGTNSTFAFSRGNTLPICAMPHGMNHWTIQTEKTDFDNGWYFHPANPAFYGFRLTHQPSPWILDYASLLIFPQTCDSQIEAGRDSCFDLKNAELSPAGIRLKSIRYNVDCFLTPTSRAAWLDFDFSAEKLDKKIVFDLFTEDSELMLSGNRVSGFVTNNHGGVPAGFRMFFTAEFSVDPCGLSRVGHIYEVALAPETTTVRIRFATSFISHRQAIANLQELSATPEQTFESGKKIWDDLLSCVTADWEYPEQSRVFYSCLYRAMLFPREFHEFSEGKKIHYSPYDGKVHDGPLYTDNGFWDTHRTLYPLLSLLDPDLLADMLEGYLHTAEEGGWFPRWCSPGYRDCMTGTHADAVFADAAVKGIALETVRKAWPYLRKDGLTPPPDNTVGGRVSLRDYMKYHFIPSDHPENNHDAAETMDSAANDYCLFAIAELLGFPEDAELFRERSSWYKNLFNPETGVLQGRNSDGSFIPFREFEWSKNYVEGSFWQCGFAVPHDSQGFIEMMGGREKMLSLLDRMLSLPPHYEIGRNPKVIHEMREMAMNGFGQYAQSNQPSHHILWLYSICGERLKCAEIVSKVAKKLYTVDNFPGDEDNGEMAAWYIFAFFGFYPFCPGKAEYIAARPLAENITIRKADGKVLMIQKADDPLEFKGNSIKHEQLAKGGTIRF